MATTTKKYQMMQLVSEDSYCLIHPETEAAVVTYTKPTTLTNVTNITTVKDALDSINYTIKNGVINKIKTPGNTTGLTTTNGEVTLNYTNLGLMGTKTGNTTKNVVELAEDALYKATTALDKSQEATSLALGRSAGWVFDDYETLVSVLSAPADITQNGATVPFSPLVGDSIYLTKVDIPDVWVSVTNVSPAASYTYTTDQDFITKLYQTVTINGRTVTGIKIDSYVLSPLESRKIDLSTYQTKQDNTLSTTSKTVVGGINEVKSGLSTLTTGLSNGSVVVNSATNATNATSATSASTANKWANARTVTVEVKSGKKSNGTTDISASGNASIDGSANKTITVELGNSGVAADTYSAVQVNAKGIVVGGAHFIEVGVSNQTTPSDSLAAGGIFFKEIS